MGRKWKAKGEIRIEKENDEIVLSPAARYEDERVEVASNADIHLGKGFIETSSKFGMKEIGTLGIRTRHDAKESTFLISPYNGGKLSNYISMLGAIASGCYAAQLYANSQAGPDIYRVGAVAIVTGLLAGIGLRYMLKRIGKYVEDKTKITINHDDAKNALRKIFS